MACEAVVSYAGVKKPHAEVTDYSAILGRDPRALITRVSLLARLTGLSQKFARGELHR